MDRIPIEIFREHILPFTYCPQSKELCKDIKSFIDVRDYLHKLYYERWNLSLEYEENADINWLENDIIRFYNNDIATMYGYHIDYITKYKRLFLLNNKDNTYIKKIISSYLRFEPKYTINSLLALLTHQERIYLVDFCETLDNFN